MPKQSKKTKHDHDMTLRLVVLAAIVFIVTMGLVYALSKISSFESARTPAPEQERQETPSAIVGEGGITKSICESGGGFWVECGNPCHGQDDEACIQVCEPQCLCGGSNDWACPSDFTCTDFEKLESDAEEIGLCRKGVSEEPSEPDRPEDQVTGPVREQPEGTICDDDNFICVDETVEDSLLASPFTVSGSGIAFENTISWELIDSDGTLLNEGFVTADAPDIGQPGDFTIRAFILTPPESADGTLKVFEHSAKDGEPIHVVEIPVRLPTRTMEVTFFSAPDPEALDCTIVQEEKGTVAFSILPIESSLRYLLASHLWEDQGGEGVTSAIPKGTRLESLNVSGGTASAVFSPELEPGGGSCAVQAIRAQIEQTLRRFSTVQNVEISVVGKTSEETLQP